MNRFERLPKARVPESRELPDTPSILMIDLEDSDECWREFLAAIDAAILDGEGPPQTSEER